MILQMLGEVIQDLTIHAGRIPVAFHLLIVLPNHRLGDRWRLEVGE